MSDYARKRLAQILAEQPPEPKPEPKPVIKAKPKRRRVRKPKAVIEEPVQRWTFTKRMTAERAAARAKAEQERRERAQKLQADIDAIMSRSLNDEPVNPPDRAERAKFLRRPFRGSLISGGV